jgi:hypothetical protein
VQYTDNSLLGKRSYELRETTLWARGTNHLNQDFEVEIPYSEFKPEYARFWVRSNNWIVAGASICVMAGIGYQVVTEPPVKTYLIGLMVGLIFVGIFLMLAGAQKIELVRFYSSNGTILMDVVKKGPRKAEFEGFVKEIQTRIRAAAPPKQA